MLSPGSTRTGAVGLPQCVTCLGDGVGDGLDAFPFGVSDALDALPLTVGGDGLDAFPFGVSALDALPLTVGDELDVLPFADNGSGKNFPHHHGALPPARSATRTATTIALIALSL